MMNGHEKSDSVIVAEKPANKAAHFAVEQSAVELAVAEPVERREQAIGFDAGQPATGGTRWSKEGGSLRTDGTSRISRET